MPGIKESGSKVVRESLGTLTGGDPSKIISRDITPVMSPPQIRQNEIIVPSEAEFS